MDDEARDTIERFHEALNRRDLDALGDLITDDCVFEATSPAPDGTRHVGRQAVLEACRAFFAGSPSTHFEMEEMFGAGDRVIVRWLYTIVMAAFGALVWFGLGVMRRHRRRKERRENRRY